MKYSANWTKYPQGNGIAEGETLIVKSNVGFQGGIYQKGILKLIINGHSKTGKLVIKRKGVKLKGLATLVLRAYDGTGVKDEFIIV
jgi:hypothetical protein